MPLSAESVTSMAKNRNTNDVELSAGSGSKTRIKEDTVPIVGGSDTSLAKITSEEELDSAVVTLSSELEKEKLSWTGKVGQQPKPKSKLFYKTQPRFDLKGALVVLEKDINKEIKKM